MTTATGEVRKNKPLRIRLVTIIEVDREAWNDEYFTEDTPAQIREVVESQAGDAIRMGFHHIAHAVKVL